MSNAMPAHHCIDYIEFSVRDVAEAKRFFTAAFGWQFTDYGPNYAGIKRVGGEGEMGGVATGEPTSGAGPLVVLFSEDLEATLRAVEAAGGAVVEAPFDFPGGRRFHFADPSGNVMAAWSAPDD